MIFVTVGGQTPFGRLVRAMDEWAGAHPETEVFAQIGEGRYVPVHMEHARFLPPEEYSRRVAVADLVVAHAGTGVLIVAAEAGARVLMMPRRAILGETRNEHQTATCAHLAGKRGVRVAADEKELCMLLDEPLADFPRPEMRPADELVRAISDFIGGSGGGAVA